MSVKNLMEPTWFDKVLEEMVNYANVRVPKEDKKDALLSFYTPVDARLGSNPNENNDTGDLALFWFAAFKHCSK